MHARKAKGQRNDLGSVITATWDYELHRTVAGASPVWGLNPGSWPRG